MQFRSFLHQPLIFPSYTPQPLASSFLTRSSMLSTSSPKLGYPSDEEDFAPNSGDYTDQDTLRFGLLPCVFDPVRRCLTVRSISSSNEVQLSTSSSSGTQDQKPEVLQPAAPLENISLPSMPSPGHASTSTQGAGPLPLANTTDRAPHVDSKEFARLSMFIDGGSYVSHNSDAD